MILAGHPSSIGGKQYDSNNSATIDELTSKDAAVTSSPVAVAGGLRGFASGLTQTIIGKAVKTYTNLLPGSNNNIGGSNNDSSNNSSNNGSNSSNSSDKPVSTAEVQASSFVADQHSLLQNIDSSGGGGGRDYISSSTAAAAAATAANDQRSRALSLGSVFTSSPPVRLLRGFQGQQMTSFDGGDVCVLQQSLPRIDINILRKEAEFGIAALQEKIDEGYGEGTDSAAADDTMEEDIDLLDVVLGVRRRSW